MDILVPSRRRSESSGTVKEARGPFAIKHAELVNLQSKYVEAEMLIGSFPFWRTAHRGELENSAPVDASLVRWHCMDIGEAEWMVL